VLGTAVEVVDVQREMGRLAVEVEDGDRDPRVVRAGGKRTFHAGPDVEVRHRYRRAAEVRDREGEDLRVAIQVVQGARRRADVGQVEASGRCPLGRRLLRNDATFG